MKRIGIAMASMIFLFFPAVLSSQTIDMKAVEAEENLRWGVIAYNNGFYNKAVQSLEKALALKPENPDVLQWLGRSYYMSGLEDAALAEWEKLIGSGRAGTSLINLSELVKYRQLLTIRPEQDDKWVIHMDLNNISGNFKLFDRPTAAVPVGDGSGGIYVVSFGTNQVLRYDANGALKETFDGGFEGYDHPFDIFPLKGGNFLLSEFTGNRVSLCGPDGNRIIKIGEKGIGKGQLLGPQYIACDGADYFYVSDTGNRKIVKYDLDGKFILEMGRSSGDYPGLLSPTGVVLLDGRIYAADSVRKAVDVFDESGNYLHTLLKGKLNFPEGLSVLDDAILISDGPLIRCYNVDNDELTVLADRTGNNVRAMNTDMDDNGNLLIADYEANRITVLTELSTVYGGLFVRIDRVNSDSFPRVIVDFSVERRDGKAVVGLDMGNFTVTEKNLPVDDYKIEFSGFNGKNTYLTVLVDGSQEMRPYGRAVTDMLKEIYQSRGDFQKSIVAAGETPYVVSSFGEGNSADAIEEATTDWSPRWTPDTGIRLAASQMIPGRDRRSVLFITQGELPSSSFDRYDVIGLASYYRNNNIAFNTVYTVPGVKNRELEYLSAYTGGESIYMYRPEGIGPLLDSIASMESAVYTVSFKSHSDADFGRAYIPVGLEALYVNKSGRDESGYYPPIQ